MTRNITNEDIEFLKDLQQKMLTQDHDCQASPRFWTVAQTEREGGIASGYADGSVIYDSHCCEDIGSTVEEVKGYLKDNDEYNEGMDEIDELDGIVDFLNEHDPDNGRRYELCNFKLIENVVKPNTFFLTKEACKQHIQANKHHYNGTVHSYAMTAWRSAQVEKLYEILVFCLAVSVILNVIMNFPMFDHDDSRFKRNDELLHDQKIHVVIFTPYHA